MHKLFPSADDNRPRPRRRSAAPFIRFLILALSACSQDECKGATPTGTVVPASCVWSTVAIVPAATTVERGDTARLTANAVGTAPCNPFTAVFSSLDPAVATIDASGLVRGITIGGPINAHLRVVGKDPIQQNTMAATVTVTTPTIATVAVIPPTATVTVGQTQQYVATGTSAGGVTPVPGQTFTWNSANPTVASVSATGLATGLTAGVANLQAIGQGTSGAKIGNATLTVVPPVAATVTSVTVVPATATISVNQTQQFTATALGAGAVVIPGQTFTWSSTVPATAAISPSGLATPAATGSTSIRATTAGVTGSAALTVVAALCTIFADDFTTGTNPFASSIFFAVGGPTQSAAHSATGGNPGGYVQMTHNMPFNSIVTVDHMFPGTYSAAALGAIAFIDYSEDRIEFTPTFLSDGGGLLVKQGVNRFEVSLTNNPQSTTWAKAARLNIRPTDLPGANFTASGAPIQFGFFRKNSNDDAPPSATGVHGIDNFEVKVCR